MGLSQPNNPPTINPGTSSPVSSGVVLGSSVSSTQVNQIRGVNNNNSSGSGIPKQVSNVQVSVANAQAGSTCTITVLFRRDPTDKSFSGVNIWVKGYQGNSKLVQVASASDSPATFTLNNTGETVSFTLQAFGNGGNAPLAQAPTNSGVLPKSTSGGFGTSTVNYFSVSNPPPAPGGTPTNLDGFFGAGYPITASVGLAITTGPIGVSVDQITVFQFILNNQITIKRVTINVAASHSSSSVNVGIFDRSGNKVLDSGAISTIATGKINVTITPVTLVPGTYYLAQSSNLGGLNTLTAITQNNTTMVDIANQNGAVKIGQAANSTSGGVMPATLGGITADSIYPNMIAALFGTA